MTWSHKEPGHQQPWYWQSIPEYSLGTRPVTDVTISALCHPRLSLCLHTSDNGWLLIDVVINCELWLMDGASMVGFELGYSYAKYQEYSYGNPARRYACFLWNMQIILPLAAIDTNGYCHSFRYTYVLSPSVWPPQNTLLLLTSWFQISPWNLVG